MEQADFNYQDFQDGQQQEQDKKMYVKFLYRKVIDRAASAEAGRTIMVEREFIHMMNPGCEPVCKPANDYYRGRCRAHYEAFKNRVAPPEHRCQWFLILTTRKMSLNSLPSRALKLLNSL